MVRPTDWDVLGLDHDPTPGDPFRVKEISGRMRDIGDEAERAARDVRGLAGDDAVMGWIGASGDAFRTHIGKFPSQLDKVATSHHLCADALLEFSNALDSSQSQADRALVQARPLHDQVRRLLAQLASAHTDLHSASKGVSAVQIVASVDPAVVQKAIRNQTAAQSAVDSLNAQLSGPVAQLEALTKLAASAESLRHAAEDTAKAKIHTAAGAGIPPDSMWHKLGHLAGDLWHGLVIVAEVVSCVGGLVLLVVGGPVWLVVAVSVAGMILFTDSVNKYADHKASLWQVGLSFLACIPITKGLTSVGALGTAFREGGVLGAGTHLVGAAGAAARPVLTGTSTFLRNGLGATVTIFADGSKVPLKAFEDGRPGFKLFRWEDPLSRWMNNIAPAPGFFDVGVHGMPDSVAYQFKGWLNSSDVNKWRAFSHYDVADMIRASGWDGRSPIRLFSCSTGKLTDGFAQGLADTLGVRVDAPDEVLWVWRDGSHLVAPLHEFLLNQPDITKMGQFSIFLPRKP